MNGLDTNGARKLGVIIKEGGLAAVAVLALGLAIWLKFDAGARPDPYTRTMAVETERRINERINRLEAVVEKHMALGAHNGADRKLAAIAASLEAIRRDITRIESKTK